MFMDILRQLYRKVELPDDSGGGSAQIGQTSAKASFKPPPSTSSNIITSRKNTLPPQQPKNIQTGITSLSAKGVRATKPIPPFFGQDEKDKQERVANLADDANTPSFPGRRKRRTELVANGSALVGQILAVQKRDGAVKEHGVVRDEKEKLEGLEIKVKNIQIKRRDGEIKKHGDPKNKILIRMNKFPF